MTSPAHEASTLSGLRGLTPITETNAHADPQVVYRKLRSKWGEVAPVELEPGINAWLVMGYEELVHVVRHERLFAKSSLHWRDYREGRIAPDSPLAPFMFPRPNAWQTDGAEHRRVRAPLEAAVNSLRIRHVARQVREVCATLIAGFAERGHADLLSEYALMIPTVVIGRLLGLDLDAARELHRVQMSLFAINEESVAANQRFEEILMTLVQARTAEPADDMTSVIVHHPNMKDDAERVNGMLLLLSAAGECSMAWIGSSIQLLLADGRFSNRLRGGRLGIDDALDEVLWREPPMANLPARFALQDTEIGGQAISRGDAIIMCFSAANADPRVHGDEWSELGNRAHLAWSAGPHICPAHVPARAMVRTAVETALHQLPGLHLTVPVEELGRLVSPWTRCPATLPVAFTPVTSAT